jgi:hypothetical protein
MSAIYDRRSFLKTTTLTLGAAALPMTLVELAFAKAEERFSFAYISDSHIQNVKGAQFVRNWDRGLIRAVAETNLLSPRPIGALLVLGRADDGVDLDAGPASLRWALGRKRRGHAVVPPAWLRAH